MAKLIVVSRDRVEASHRRLEELLAKDPQWQEEKKELERRQAKEKKRRDAEYAAKRAAYKESGKETK